MKQLLLFLTFALSSFLQAQTAIIAHKSHSGTASTFVIDPSGNFGEPAPRLKQVVRLNDTTSLEIYSDFGGFSYYDTVYRNPQYANYELNIDSLNKGNAYFRVDYINFKNSPDSLKQQLPGYAQPTRLYKDETIPETIQIEPVQENPPKKKKKSYLLFLFGITGGGMLLFRILNRLFTPQTV
ncbi:hypothetical protein D3C71_530800 [compost metagenome]